MKNWGNEQVFVCFDGPTGLVIQTTRQSYESYYKLLGWQLMGKAAELPLVWPDQKFSEDILASARKVSAAWGAKSGDGERLICQK